ncbi:histidine kinase [Chryseolinea sp. T2]|uniref:histidine kinase n=1 Tax=Chryseolinea sp. T2 TaxID=3129255 RepID=UPI00307800CB
MNSVSKAFLLVVFALTFSGMSLLAQSSTQSLRTIAGAKYTYETARIDSLNQASLFYLNLGMKDSSDYFALHALAEANHAGYVQGKFEAINNLGSVELLLGNFAKAEEYLTQATDLYETVSPRNDSVLIACYTNLGLARWAQSKFESAVSVYRNGEKLAMIRKDQKQLSALYVHLSALEAQRGHYRTSIEYGLKGLPIWRNPATFDAGGFCTLSFVYNSFGDYRSSLAYYHEAIRMMKAQAIDYDRTLYTFIGETFLLAGKYDSAMYYYNVVHEKSISHSVTRPALNSRDTYWCDSRMAEVDVMNGDIEVGINKLKKSLTGFASIDDINQVMWTLLRMMKAYELANDPALSMEAARSLLALSAQKGARQYVRDASSMLSKLYERESEYDSAYKYLKQYIHYKDIIDSDQVQQQLAALQSRYEQQELQASLGKSELQLHQARSQKIYFASALMMVVAIGMIAFRNVSLRRKAENQRLATIQNELRLQKLEGDSTKAALQHRAAELEMQALRLQMNPHFIFNSLNSINRYILTNDRALASDYLTTFSKLIRLILSNSQFSHIGLDSELEGLNLYLKLESLRFENRFVHSITISEDIDPSELKVPPLFLQPYVENAIWHGLMHKSESGILNIEVRKTDQQLQFTITDNGVGRAQAAALSSKSATRHKSLGLKITADRISHMLGNASDYPISIKDLVNIDGCAAGTEVTIKIPVMYD